MDKKVIARKIILATLFVAIVVLFVTLPSRADDHADIQVQQENCMK